MLCKPNSNNLRIGLSKERKTYYSTKEITESESSSTIYTTNLQMTATNAYITAPNTPLTKTKPIWAGDRFFYALTNQPYCYHSTDGINWTEVKLPEMFNGKEFVSVAGWTNKYYIITHPNNGKPSEVYYSNNFENWEKVTMPDVRDYYGAPMMFYHETLNEMVGIYPFYSSWFQEDYPTKFSFLDSQKKPDEYLTHRIHNICYDGSKYIAYTAQKNNPCLFMTLGDAYKETNLSYVLAEILSRMNTIAENTKPT